MGETNSGPPSLFASFLADLGRALFSEYQGQVMASFSDLKDLLNADAARLQEISAHFDAAHSAVTVAVADLRAKIQELTDRLSNVEVPTDIMDLARGVGDQAGTVDSKVADLAGEFPPPAPPPPGP